MLLNAINALMPVCLAAGLAQINGVFKINDAKLILKSGYFIYDYV